MSGVLTLTWCYKWKDHRRKVTVVRQIIRTSDNLAGRGHGRFASSERCSDGTSDNEFFDDTPQPGVRGVSGVRAIDGTYNEDERVENPETDLFIWSVERKTAENFRDLGRRLAESGGLYRNAEVGYGLIQVLPTGDSRLITKGKDICPIIVDQMHMQLVKAGKYAGDMPSSRHLDAMLHAESFLQEFMPLDAITRTPFYLADFSIVQPGFNRGRPGSQVYYVGEAPLCATRFERLEQFLSVMQFATNADRTNFVGAMLTMPLRRHWPGEKPLIFITSTRSHSGKGTLTECLRGGIPKAEISYQSKDWPMQNQFYQQVQAESDIGVVVIDNVRLDSSGGGATFIRSAYWESFLTNSELKLSSSQSGEQLRMPNRFVVILNANDGKLSRDLLNRSLPIHLAPTCDPQDQQSPIGNPRLEFLPQFGPQIDAEIRGMIERWKDAGMPCDNSVRYPMANWAKTVGGILMVNGFTDFLANYRATASTADPVREALAILGVSQLGEALRPAEWAELAVAQGLAKTLFPPNERDTPAGRERSIGCIMKRHLKLDFHAETDTKFYCLRLDGGIRRWTRGANPQARYRFEVLNETEKPEDVAE
jgi:hypothetical protein